MAVSRTLLKAIAHQVDDPAEVLRRLNVLLIPESDAHTFVTVFFGVLNIRAGDVAYGSGGHNPPYVVRADGSVEQLPLCNGALLGKLMNVEFETKRLQLKPGDAMFLYTDGVSEAMDAEMNMYDESRLETYLRGSAGSSIQDLVRGSIVDIKKHTRDAIQSDDITVLMLRYAGSNGRQPGPHA
jgi:sigma-B regulation protein RsbU (phosphoserine phosphatase)